MNETNKKKTIRNRGEYKKVVRMGEKSKYSRTNHIDMNIVEFTWSKACSLTLFLDHLLVSFVYIVLGGVVLFIFVVWTFSFLCRYSCWCLFFFFCCLYSIKIHNDGSSLASSSISFSFFFCCIYSQSTVYSVFFWAFTCVCSFVAVIVQFCGSRKQVNSANVYGVLFFPFALCTNTRRSWSSLLFFCCWVCAVCFLHFCRSIVQFHHPICCASLSPYVFLFVYISRMQMI